MTHTGETKEMKKELTLGNLLSVGVPLILVIIGWGISVNTHMESNEVRTDRNSRDIEKNTERIEKVDDKIDENFKLILEKLDKVEEKLSK